MYKLKKSKIPTISPLEKSKKSPSLTKNSPWNKFPP